MKLLCQHIPTLDLLKDDLLLEVDHKSMNDEYRIIVDELSMNKHPNHLQTFQI